MYMYIEIDKDGSRDLEGGGRSIYRESEVRRDSEKDRDVEIYIWEYNEIYRDVSRESGRGRDRAVRERGSDKERESSLYKWRFIRRYEGRARV